MTLFPPRLFRSRHFWIVGTITLFLVLFYYSSLFPARTLPALPGFLVLNRYSSVRILFMLPVAYAANIWGIRAGMGMVVLMLLALLPRAILISYFPYEATIESLSAAGLAVLINLGLEVHRRETARRDQALLKLESSRRQLESYLKEIRKNERSISALQSISSTINRSLLLDEVLQEAANKIEQVLEIDILSIFLLDANAEWLELRVARGMSDRFSAAIRKMRVGEGFNGWVVQTGQPCSLADVSQDSRAGAPLQEEGIRSLHIVPLKSSSKIIGTLGVARRSTATFDAATTELLALIGTELGVAAEKAALFQQLQEYTDQISRAGEAERLRIARELHDDTIQTLVAVSRRLDNFAAGLQMSPVMIQPLEQLHKEIDDALVRIRRFVHDLRPPTLEYLGLLPALRELVAQVSEQSGIPVQLSAGEHDRPFSNEESLLIYRVIQEALRNVWKHSRATLATVDLASQSDQTVVRIADHGRGFDMKESRDNIEEGKLGLMGMKERAHLLRGTLEIESEPGRGTVVTLRVPASCRLKPG